ESDLLNCGVPQEWLNDVCQANEDSILDVAGHLPAEAAEAVLRLATGEALPGMLMGRATTHDHAIAPVATLPNPFTHPDAQRRFRLIHNLDELERALDYPWDKWTVFLHPAQRSIVERNYNGPARVTGSAGTGKTVVAL